MHPKAVEQAIRDAHQVLRDRGVTMAPAKVARLARDFVKAAPPCSLATFLVRNASPSLSSAPPSRCSRQATQWQDPTGDEVAFQLDRNYSSLGDHASRLPHHGHDGAGVIFGPIRNSKKDNESQEGAA